MLPLQEILKIAVRAPSGDNSQPWRFVREGDTLFLFNLPEKDHPLLNVKQSGSYIAHGALIENITVAASGYGYEVITTVFPNPTDKNLVASLVFKKNESVQKSPLFDAISRRSTNRRPFSGGISLEQQQLLLKYLSSEDKATIVFVDEKNKKQVIASASSVMEKVALENEKLHRLFFSDIIWSAAVEKIKTRGLFIKTLELPPPVQLLFRLLKNWSFTKMLNFVGFSTLASKGNAATYATGTLALIAIDSDSPEEFVRVGRILQKIWLQATFLDLGLQPVTGLLFLYRKMLEGDDFLSSSHRQLIKTAYDNIEGGFGVKNKTLAFLFRVGSAKPPSTRTSRLSPVIE